MRKSIRKQSRRHLWLYDEDWDFVSTHVASRTRLSPGSWMREMIHRVVVQLREERTLSQEAASRLLDFVKKQEEEAQEDKLPEPQKAEMRHD